MSSKRLALILICAAVCLTGCAGTRTIYVPDGTPIQIREPIEDAPVWVYDGAGAKTPGEIDIPAGWWALSDPGGE